MNDHFKQHFTYGSFLAIILFLLGYPRASRTALIVATVPELTILIFSIEGMHCEVGCAGVIQKKLAKFMIFLA